MKNAILTSAIIITFNYCCVYAVDYLPRSEQLTDKQLELDIGKAYNENDKIAMHRLARHYLSLGSYEKSLQWMRLSAVLGNVQAQHEFYVVANIHFENDKEISFEAVIWLEKACLNKYDPAIFQQKAIKNLYSGKTARDKFYEKFNVK